MTDFLTAQKTMQQTFKGAGGLGSAGSRVRQPDPPLQQPPGDVFFCGCLECRQIGKTFVSRATWFRHDPAREQQVQEGLVPPPHSSYKQPRRKAQEGARKRRWIETTTSEGRTASGISADMDVSSRSPHQGDVDLHTGRPDMSHHEIDNDPWYTVSIYSMY